MPQSPSSSKKMLDSLNKRDPMAFYISFDAPSQSKMLTISPVNIAEANPLTPQSPIDLNNPTPSHQPGPYSSMLSDHLFEGDLPKIFDQTPKVGVYPSFDSTDIGEDNVPFKWSIKSKEKEIWHAVFEMPSDDVVDVSIEVSEHECVGEDSPLGDVIKEKGKQGPGPKRKKDDHAVSKQSIVNNLRLQKVLGGRVFDPDIITKLGMDYLCDLVEIQSCTHLFKIKSHVLHDEDVREFYYNVEFAEGGSLNTRVGDKSLHLDE
ncbi:hypothetical protein H5410_021164 [Solanum commersonii]|uniref:Uncharacterized protein n=1 Tax=Solanum commersonii TaxID=4109 RepID=A0A9J5ZA72_SOLCO|nr:hypothetical protein H5410_021164 [Solanum commersonii]